MSDDGIVDQRTGATQETLERSRLLLREMNTLERASLLRLLEQACAGLAGARGILERDEGPHEASHMDLRENLSEAIESTWNVLIAVQTADATKVMTEDLPSHPNVTGRSPSNEKSIHLIASALETSVESLRETHRTGPDDETTLGESEVRALNRILELAESLRKLAP